jgi:hypothetical protein
MNGRVLLGGLLSLVCLAALWSVWDQRSQLTSLRAEQQQAMARLVAPADRAASAGPAESAGAGSADRSAAPAPTPELLRLRSEVTRLTERRRELAGVRAENERLRAQLASRGTNGSGGFQLPSGYIRRRDARMMGFGSPEDTLQTLLWAIQNHDLTNMLQAFTPERAEALRAQAGESREANERLFNEAQGPVGVRIVNRKQNASDGSITLELEVVPEEAGPRITFRQINGQWKVGEPF